MEPFTVGTINLSMKDHTTEEVLTANVYSVPGVNNDRPMSIGQLVMAICLARANEMEGRIIELMEEMDNTSTDLERLTEIEKKLIAEEELTMEELDFLADEQELNLWRSNALLARDLDSKFSFFRPPNEAEALLVNRLEDDPNYQLTDADLEILARHDVRLYEASEQTITDIEAKMDSMNSFSQEKMIELQSQTNKRDQAYDMVANILKSLHTVLVGTANNF